jgi:hypothetical protein
MRAALIWREASRGGFRRYADQARAASAMRARSRYKICHTRSRLRRSLSASAGKTTRECAKQRDLLLQHDVMRQHLAVLLLFHAIVDVHLPSLFSARPFTRRPEVLPSSTMLLMFHYLLR